MIKMILEMSSSVMSENKEQREQISSLGKSIEELQDIIRDLKSQPIKTQTTAQNHHQAMVTKRVLKREV